MTRDEIIETIAPLKPLIGTWQGDKGIDIAPSKQGEDTNPFYETITIEPIGVVTNAGKQELMVVNYTQIVTRKSDDEVFHHEVGYYEFDAATKTLTQSFTIPRAVAIVATAKVENNSETEIEFTVVAKLDDKKDNIAQASFMFDNAKTTGFEHWLKVSGDTLQYKETTFLEIYGKTHNHTDENILKKV